jgi:hypothetical protein
LELSSAAMLEPVHEPEREQLVGQHRNDRYRHDEADEHGRGHRDRDVAEHHADFELQEHDRQEDGDGGQR